MDKATHQVTVYTIWHNQLSWTVDGIEKAREYAKRMITEGVWYTDEGTEVFLPVHQVVKVKIKEIQ